MNLIRSKIKASRNSLLLHPISVITCWKVLTVTGNKHDGNIRANLGKPSQRP